MFCVCVTDVAGEYKCKAAFRDILYLSVLRMGGGKLALKGPQFCDKPELSRRRLEQKGSHGDRKDQSGSRRERTDQGDDVRQTSRNLRGGLSFVFSVWRVSY